MITKPTVAHIRRAAAAGGFTLVVAVSLLSSAAPATAIRVWVVGSPYTDAAPERPAAVRLSAAASKRGYALSVDTFPARGFAATFADAVARNNAPDVLVFDNFGVMDGISTDVGRFDGIASDPTLRPQFIKVTGVFDELLGRARGWTYLFAFSPNHAVAKSLALSAPECTSPDLAGQRSGDLGRVAIDSASAYLTGDTITLQGYSDPERLPGAHLPRGALSVGGFASCGSWGNNRVAIVLMNGAYVAEGAVGEARVLLVFRKPASQWQLLVATRDPLSTGEFVKNVPRFVARLAPDASTPLLPIPATLTSPGTGRFPEARREQRFGTFTWRMSGSDDVVADIAEFGYDDDERLFLIQPTTPSGRGEISAGQLWTTRRDWSWRVWSVSRSGDVVFSEWRTFVH